MGAGLTSGLVGPECAAAVGVTNMCSASGEKAIQATSATSAAPRTVRLRQNARDASAEPARGADAPAEANGGGVDATRPRGACASALHDAVFDAERARCAFASGPHAASGNGALGASPARGATPPADANGGGVDITRPRAACATDGVLDIDPVCCAWE
jgi:hypothetical protein